MNWDQVEGNWRQLKGKFKEQWGKLTDDDLNLIQGKYERLAGKLQELYGFPRVEVERQIQEFLAKIEKPAGAERAGHGRKSADMPDKKVSAA